MLPRIGHLSSRLVQAVVTRAHSVSYKVRSREEPEEVSTSHSPTSLASGGPRTPRFASSRARVRIARGANSEPEPLLGRLKIEDVGI
jgi:hypothetical protein